jgi:hypothetical protein
MQSAEHSSHAKHDAPLTIGPSQLGAVVAAAVAIAIAARFFDSGVPVVAAVIIAALVPKAHGWDVRGPIAAMAGLLALFIVRMWPGAEAAAPATTANAANAAVGGHTLTWIVAVPLAGALGILLCRGRLTRRCGRRR